MASKRAIRRRQCTNKIRWPNEAGAWMAARRTQKQLASKQKMTVYHCKLCNGYHVAHRKGYR